MKKVLAVCIAFWMASHWLHTAYIVCVKVVEYKSVSIIFSAIMTLLAIIALVYLPFEGE